jgi:AcrR family transcriptional regulator
MEEAEVRIATIAGRMFHEHGITATGVEALSRAAGISKRTLYERFGSKEHLVAAALSVYDVPVFEATVGAAEAGAADPRGQLECLFTELERLVTEADFRGCPFVNAASELTDPDHPAHEVIRRHKQRMQGWMRDKALAAGCGDPDLLSRQLMIVVDGAQAQSVVKRSAQPVRDACRLALTLIDAALPAGG